jgi:hypothetical protein
MNKLTLILTLLLTGCGGTAPDSQAAQGVSVAAQEQSFTTFVNGYTGAVQGQGATQRDRQYDAVAYVASSYKPGSDGYRLMLSDGGLQVMISDSKGQGAVFLVTLRNDGMHIAG